MCVAMCTSTYEKEYARLVGAGHAIAFAYARHALTSILLAADLSAGDEVILSPLTCKVVPLALLSLDLKPIYADISADTLNIAPQCVESAIGNNTKAVIFQHSAQRNLMLIEDCAQCLPFSSDKHNPGSWGQAAIFSNNLRKPLPAGSGGVAVTKDNQLADRIRQYRDSLPNRGKFAEMLMRVEALVHKYLLRPSSYWFFYELKRQLSSTHRQQSIKSQIDNEITNAAFQISEYQACQGMSWLEAIKENLKHRQTCCAEYKEALSSTVGLEIVCSDSREPLYCFPILVDHKDDLLKIARRRFIELIAWPICMPIYPLKKESELPAYGYQPGQCPIAEKVARRLIGLPVDQLTNSQHREAIVILIRNHCKNDRHE
jgi:dTDP-4-amino-4,6-dideoxygalactose transaminase